MAKHETVQENKKQSRQKKDYEKKETVSENKLSWEHYDKTRNCARKEETEQIEKRLLQNMCQKTKNRVDRKRIMTK